MLGAESPAESRVLCEKAPPHLPLGCCTLSNAPLFPRRCFRCRNPFVFQAQSTRLHTPWELLQAEAEHEGKVCSSPNTFTVPFVCFGWNSLASEPCNEV